MKNWMTEIKQVILERSENTCEHCRVADKQLILRHAASDDYLIYDFDEDVHYDDFGEPVRLSEFPEGYEDSQYIVVALAIAHDSHDPADYGAANLIVLCQHCEAKHNAPVRAREEAAKRQREHDERTGQLKMFE